MGGEGGRDGGREELVGRVGVNKEEREGDSSGRADANRALVVEGTVHAADDAVADWERSRKQLRR